MRPEWHTYKKETLKSTRSVFLALGVSLVFWLFRLPETPKDEYILRLGISGVYGLTIFGYVWVLFALAFAMTTQFSIKSGRFIPLGWSVLIPLALFGMAIGVLTARYFEALILNEPFSTSGFLESLMIGSFITLMFTFYFAYKHSAAEILELKAIKAESELHALKNQLQPHFLFNSLNSLSELIETNKDGAADMAMKLSGLYREILENSKKPLVSLNSEVSIIEKYLDLEKIRFGERLKFSISVPRESERIMLPPLIIQTLVENALKHGIAQSVWGGAIDVSVHAKGNTGYVLRVVNTAGTTTKASASNTGLANTKARLDLVYGTRHGFSLKDQGSSIEASFWFSGDLADA